MTEYIERNELIATIKRELAKSSSTIYVCEDGTVIHTDVGYVEEWLDDYTEVLKSRPAADVVEVKRGRWIDVPYAYFGAKRYMCDQCSEDEYWEGRFHIVKENFCPNCGADMREEEKDG